MQKLWEIEDIIDKRGNADNEELLVKWKDWNGPSSWVSLNFNPELRAYIQENRLNPSCGTYFKQTLKYANDFDSDIEALKQAIYDALGEFRYTLDGTLGRQRRITIKVPFRQQSYDFLRDKVKSLNSKGPGNAECHIAGKEFDNVLGDGWDKRCYKTSTETYVNRSEYIHLSWGYKERIRYDHSSCKR